MHRIYRNFLLYLWVGLLSIGFAFAQTEELLSKIKTKEAELQAIEQEWEEKQSELEGVKLSYVSSVLQDMGYPQSKNQGEIISHSAFVLEYAEEHEQAAWVFHVIMPDIISGNESRSNDFRVDSLVLTGTAIEQDYFLKHTLESGEIEYDGFGYDRGHLAPSADFKWSSKALSETYYYSNMSPQLPEFNREIWAKLEGMLRAYVYRTGKPLYVVTGGVLNSDLPVIERSINKVSIPERFYKVVVDPESKQGIGFLIPNQKSGYAFLESYAASIDTIEELTGINFFTQLNSEEEIERAINVKHWLPEERKEDVQPLNATQLPRNTVNSFQAGTYIDKGKKITVCGTVVSTHQSKKGNVFLNLDRAFPNQIFSVSIWSDDLINFSYEPHVVLKDQKVCVTGKVGSYRGTASMNIAREEQIEYPHVYE